MTKTGWLLVIGAVVGILLAIQWTFWTQMSEKERVIASSPFPIVGRSAPTFELPTLDGTMVRSEDLRPPYVLYFWTTNCAICKRELPLLDAYDAEYGAYVPLITICGGTSWDSARELVASYGLQATVLYDDYRVASRAYQPADAADGRQVTTFPYLAMVDEAGLVVYARSGRIPSVEQLIDAMVALDFPVPAPPEPTEDPDGGALAPVVTP
ncbi:TlpA family protein disulfide reductase [Candidatus Bipolaricaulota bacterium]|nr:TlpA family protein disulfide reductase [Candidatus Bipolaricaulota bacterium]